MTASRRPGEDFTYYTRDYTDRVILMQTGRQRTEGKQTFLLYDAMGRLCVQGECRNTESTYALMWETITTTYQGSGGVGNTGYVTSLELVEKYSL